MNENIGGIFTNKKPIGFGKGPKNSMYGRKRPDRSRMNQERVNPFFGKTRPEHSVKMKGKNNYDRWKFEIISNYIQDHRI